MSIEDSSEYLNELAHKVLADLEAGAVVLMALVRDEDGELALAVGSTGLPSTTQLIAKAMPDVADQLEAAANREDPTRTGFYARAKDPHAN